jgi:hypothetical protein
MSPMSSEPRELSIMSDPDRDLVADVSDTEMVGKVSLPVFVSSMLAMTLCIDWVM